MATTVKYKEYVTHTQGEDGMLVEHREPVFAYVHCYNVACPSYHDPQRDLIFERKVPGVLFETSWTHLDLGGDNDNIERSDLAVRTEDPADEKCPDCGNAVNVSHEASHKLSPWASRANADTLAAYQAARKVAEQEGEAATGERDAELAEMRQAMKDQAEVLAELKAQMPAKKSPGRPRKDGSPAQPRKATDGED